MNPFIKTLAKQLASKINGKVDIPFLNEEQEQMFFELVVTTILELVLGHWLSLLETKETKQT